MSALEFRQCYDGEGMLGRFREELVLPFGLALRGFSPLGAVPHWTSRAERGGAGALAPAAPTSAAASSVPAGPAETPVLEAPLPGG